MRRAATARQALPAFQLGAPMSIARLNLRHDARFDRPRLRLSLLDRRRPGAAGRKRETVQLDAVVVEAGSGAGGSGAGTGDQSPGVTAKAGTALVTTTTQRTDPTA